MFGIMEGTNRRGRPKRERLEDIQEWCNMDMYRPSTAFARKHKEERSLANNRTSGSGHQRALIP